MEALVSIIIPIYNVEKYIDECIKSVINQTYRNLEIILINDGSTDSSYDICKKYSETDYRIILLNKENRGSASAKNSGLKIAKGDYITFVDSDDFIQDDMIEYMVDQIEKTKADIIQCDFINLYKDSNEVGQQELTEKTISSQVFLKLFLTQWKNSLFWNKLFKRDVIKGVYFKEGRCIDDEFFTYKCVINSESVSLSNKIVYNYRMRKSGVMKSETSQKQILRDRVDYLIERYRIVSDIYKDLEKEFLEHMLTYYLIISRDYYIDENLITYIKENLKYLKWKVIISNIDIRIKIQITKLIICNPKKYISSENHLNEVQMDVDNYFE